jgi:hypothetical protein
MDGVQATAAAAGAGCVAGWIQTSGTLAATGCGSGRSGS